MAILLDVSGTIFASIHVDIAGGEDPHMEYIRHLLINSIRYYNETFRDEFGEMTIVMDGKSWRKEVFPLYKWERGQGRDKDDNNWEKIFGYVQEITDDLKEHFPYPVIEHPRAEADDVIAVLCREATEPTLIISNDKDLVALTKLPHVKQWRPCIASKSKDKSAGFLNMTLEEIRRFEFNLCITGDKTDGVPSIRCPDDFLKVQYEQRTAGEKVMRAPAITEKFKNALWDAYNVSSEAFKKELGHEQAQRFARNYQLICLNAIPSDIYEEVKGLYTNVNRNPAMKFMTYVMDKRMGAFAQKMSDFTPKQFTPTNTIFG